MLKLIGIAAACIGVLIVVVLAYAATRPGSFRVARSTIINAPAETIFPLINDYRRWSAWSPYETKDPQMKRSYGRTTTGKGATYAWEGDSNVGAGNMAIADSVPPSKVHIKLNMLKPIEAHNDVLFTLEFERQRDQGHLGHAGARAVPRQGHARLFQCRQNGRRRFRGGPRQSQAGCGKPVAVAGDAERRSGENPHKRQ